MIGARARGFSSFRPLFAEVDPLTITTINVDYLKVLCQGALLLFNYRKA